jgi:cytidine deaminase
MQSSKRGLQFQQLLETFPTSVREHLTTITQTGGMLSAEHCQTVMETLGISVEALMLRLLPAAMLYSRTPISNFQVGAVAKARMSDDTDEFSLFLGANIEFPAQALTQTIHAEQSAVINAWLQGARRIETIAVTAAPCGYCRQFLYELDDDHDLKVLINKQTGEKTTPHNLSDFLPQAFGPRELGQATGLIASPAQPAGLNLQQSSNDSFVQKALSAANKSYAPYSHNLAGCAIEAGNGKIYAGRYAENAAFNPSLSPLHTAIIRLRMDNFDSDIKITRAVLVERSTSISQRLVCELLLQTMAPGVNLEYLQAV